MDEQNQPNFEKPRKLQQALRALEKDRLFVAETVDDALRRTAREHFGQQKFESAAESGEVLRAEDLIFHAKHKPVRIDPRVRRWHKWLPLAASLTIAAVIFFFARTNTAQAGDLNRDGRLDVIDAMLLTERVKSGAPMARNTDLNRDGNVDARDADEILVRAVDLERSGS